jgi:hypothetical protein
MKVKPIVMAVPRIGDVRGPFEHRECDVRASQHGADGEACRSRADNQRVGVFG